jgi:putative ABC transport system substrate-binding protein
LASGTLWRAVREVTDTLPIVGFNVDADALIERGWAESWAHPGDNITGLANAGRQLSRKMVEALIGCVPDLKRLALMSNLQSSPDTEARLRTIAQQFGLALLILSVRALAHVEPAFERARAWNAQAITADGLVPVSILAPTVTSIAARHLPADWRSTAPTQ